VSYPVSLLVNTVRQMSRKFLGQPGVASDLVHDEGGEYADA
jgi:hypothetical protein